MHEHKVLEAGAVQVQSELYNALLTKWPKMVVTGTKIPEYLALEVIRRTDDFFSFPIGNDKDFIAKAVKAVRYPDMLDFRDDGSLPRYFNERSRWMDAWEYISTEYVVNSWISCSFIGGPHGWCHPDGTIGFSDNIGKWPTVPKVCADWSSIASEFPMLEIEATLFDNEAGHEDTKPVVSILIRNGKVELVDPRVRNIHEEFSRTIEPEKDIQECFLSIIHGTMSEHALPLETLEAWGKKIFG